ncbi:hypothetical protein [Cellulosimicrobium sp. TH-20]|uniref:hypothetical protein n=1 Tax=Cellulosimicrobium sp. TH-20 TaxID=1980001 RepID=UPI00119D5814|nr:hypothetical protein [Cellulosimicrobium sp. TH-20]
MSTDTTRNLPAAAEALAAVVPFTYGDAQYAVLPTSEWTVDALESFETGRVTTFLRAVIPAEHWTAFKATGPKVPDLNGFVLALQKAVGVSGN